MFRCTKAITTTAAVINSLPIHSGSIYSTNNLGSSNIVFELWDGNGWGDNNQFEITDNQATQTDDNGNTVKYGTASFNTQYFTVEE